MGSNTLETVSETGEEPDFIVGIGASAGGIEAIQELLKHLPQGNLVYIICQHLSPNHSSMLVDILARDSEIRVESLRDDTPMAPNRIYVTPPNCHVEVTHQGFVLSKPDKESFPKPSIDKLFNSIAREFGPKGIGIVLSGTGSDGAVGVTSIRTCGGTNVAQDPSSCKYDGMPQAAIGTGMVDAVENVAGIARVIERMVGEHPEQETENSTDKAYDQVLRIIKENAEIDLYGYKKATIKRRLRRRMSILGIDSIAAYARFLPEHQSEINAFIQDSFIVVTEFMRDPESFEKLDMLVRQALDNGQFGHEMRIWVVGCATGEEAFSLAMLLDDYNRRADAPVSYKIFATDVSKSAIEKARVGEYSLEQMQNLSPEFRDRYFDDVDLLFTVKREIRDRVVFSCHNILSDPPFSNIHLVTCRNLLIYMNEYLQDTILSTLHYALAQNGYLFLGATETVRDKGYFTALDRKHRLYARDNSKRSSLNLQPIKKSYSPLATANSGRLYKNTVENVLNEYLAQGFGPPTAVVNDDDDIIFSSGDIEPFLQRRDGVSTLNLLDLVRDDMRAELKALVFKVRRLMVPVEGSLYQVLDGGEPRRVQICISPYSGQLNRWLYISFVQVPEPSEASTKSGEEDPALLLLKNELSQTRDNLQTVVEELETSNEQLQVYVEELQTSNEEYQSANEELQTVNEELQSTNEELLTVNDELVERTLAQEQLANDIINIQESLELPLFIVNKEFRIKVFTRSCGMVADTKNLKQEDIVFAIDWHGEIPGFRDCLTKVMNSGEIARMNVEIQDKTYRCQVSPYRNQFRDVEGLTIIFYETTDLVNTLGALNEEKHLAQATLNSIADGVIRLNATACVEFMNPAAQRLLQWDREAASHKNINDIFKVFHENDAFDVSRLVEQLASGEQSEQTAHDHLVLKTRYGNDIAVEFNISPLTSHDKQLSGALLAFRDVTEKQSQMRQLLWNSKHDALTGLINRDEMEKRVDSAILSARRSKVRSSFMYLDLDQFKLVNDTCGHLAGDQLLKQVSEIVHNCIRTRDTVARLGGDEFAVLLENCPLVDSENSARKIQRAVSEYRFAWEEQLFRIGVSIGIVEINDQSTQVSEILSDADAACYSAKEQGRNRIQIHSADDALLEQQRLQMRAISDINEAIEHDRFRLYFQEIQCQTDQRIMCWEVLIRMFNRRGEFLLPDRFMPAAERFGLINRIDSWVLANSLKKFSEFAEYADVNHFPQLNINLSGETLGNDNLIKELEQGLENHSVDPSKICFEVTETAAIRNFLKAKTFMQNIRDMGCKFALDDFGTGMSSLSYLRDLPTDFVKIDKTFIENVESDPISQCIVKSVCEVCDLMGITTIAEGIEGENQHDAVKALGINAIQGFHVGKPVPVEEFVSRIKSTIAA